MRTSIGPRNMVMETSKAVTRQTLYDQVWTHPMVTVAAKYGVSSSYMARVCERLNVPRPARGYWAQLEVGKAPAKPPLPDARVGDDLEWSRDGDQTHSHRPAPRPPATASVAFRVDDDDMHIYGHFPVSLKE